MASVRTEVDTAVRTLFARCTPLCGFSVVGLPDARAPSAAICLAEVTLQPWADTPAESVADEIAAALGELVDECPEARALLEGRTFARTLQ